MRSNNSRPRAASAFPTFLGGPFLALFICLLFATQMHAGTELSRFHSYTNALDHQVHHAFTVARYKRGLFFGSCGPSTKSLQWSYDFDVAGGGSQVVAEQIKLTSSDFSVVEIAAGSIKIDQAGGVVQIQLVVQEKGKGQPFVGNGTYKVKSEK